MPTTIAPADEACEALVARINAAGAAYTLPTAATYSYQEVEGLEEITGLRVDVVPISEKVLDQTLDGANYSSHQIRIVIRKQVTDTTPTTIKPLTLIRRQIFERLDNWDSSDKRVRVWDASIEDDESPSKVDLRDKQLYRASILLRVEVAP
jgi:hypothetical protein